MTEEKSFDQPQMSKPDIPKEEGVHSVAGKKQGKLLNMRCRCPGPNRAYCIYFT